MSSEAKWGGAERNVVKTASESGARLVKCGGESGEGGGRAEAESADEETLTPKRRGANVGVREMDGRRG